jgi:hypothetical protein
VIGNRRSLLARPRALAVAVLLLLPCLAPDVAAQWTEPRGTFRAYWNVTGTVHLLDFDGGTVAAGSHQGTVVLNTSQGTVPAFETDCVAFRDDRTGGLGRCVWKGPLGDLVYVEIESSGPAGFGRARGRFVKGTGEYEGIQGGFSFEWNYSVSRGRDATFDGHTLEMTGNYNLPSR